MNNFISSLPDDMLSHVVGFLPPRDFYSLKTVVSSGLREHPRDQINCYYWWREEVPIARAARAGCPSLIRWVAANDLELEPEELVAAAPLTPTQPAAVALYHACLRWPAALPQLLEQWVELDRASMFHFQIARSATATMEVFDTIYLHSRWLCLSIAFRYTPRAFVRWAFGGFIDVADPEVILNLRFVLHHLDARDRLVLIRILNKYHDWLWSTKIERTATLQTIAALQGLEVGQIKVVKFDPTRHLEQALASPQHDYLEYLLLRGLEVDPDMVRRTYDLKKMRLLMTAQVVQKYQKIMVMIFILIVALLANVVLPLTRAAIARPAPKLKLATG
jgi:hypothetical protein